MKISREYADKILAAWEAASPTERLRLPRMSWVAVDDTVYFETPPSKLELQAADRIDDLEFEIEVLRRYGNKDCTAMADEQIAKKHAGEKCDFED